MARESIGEVLAIIPARGGSKGIPRKNVKLLAGRPLIAHSIEQARQARHITRVVVSTDDAEIAEVARQYGAEVIQRPAEISGDTASSESALLHVLDHLRVTENYEPEFVVFLQATSPCRLPADIDGAIATLVREKADSVFSACPEHFTGRWRGDAAGHAGPVNFIPGKRPRRQEYPIEYLENGSIYVFRPAVLRETGSRMGGRISLYPMPPLRSMQIDEPGDFDTFAALLRAAVDETRSGDAAPPSIRAPNAVRGVNVSQCVSLSEPQTQCGVGDGRGSAECPHQSPERSEWGERGQPSPKRSAGGACTEPAPSLPAAAAFVPGSVSRTAAAAFVPGSVSRTAETACVPRSAGPASSEAGSEQSPKRSAGWACAKPAPPTERLTAIRLLVFDFDGVMTDNRVLIDQDGREAVLCNRGDGLGLSRLRKRGHPELLVLSTEENPVVTARCRKLGLTCVQSVGDKLQTLQELACRKGLNAEQIAYVGNDTNDLACLQWVGLPIAVADAVPEILGLCQWVTQNRGGHGAVREVCDWFLTLPAPPT